jgi:pimeloyl-ACP methyl ester carboxylesterase
VAYAAVPGLGLGLESWTGALAALGADPGRVHLLPGYGEPIGQRDAPTPTELASILCSRLAAPTTLFGHSASCQVVAHAARLCPELVRRVVLVGLTTDPCASGWPGLVGLWLRTAVHEDPRQVPQLVRQHGRTTLRSMLATMEAARHDDVLATVSQVTCPLVLVRAVRDRIARPDWIRALADAAMVGSVLEIPVGAHMVQMTHPRAFADGLAPLLA